jgi:UDP-N-acetyl-D-mannosaminuronic acid dehydrogenase
MKICVVGLGYIGLPTAAMLASRGHEVLGCDIRQDVVDTINAGRSHFQEPDLQMLLDAAIGTGKLVAKREPEAADYFIIAVPTPVEPGGAADMSYVERAAMSLVPVLATGCTVILESTSPVGSTEALAETMRKARPDLRFPRYKVEDGEPADVAVCHCPERILPGRMVRELVANDRIIGGLTRACTERARALYDSFVVGNCFNTDSRAAELAKLTENAFRDVNIAFANELSIICDRLGVDVWEVRELANHHPRVSILEPGAGVGGHCIAVDPWFIVQSAPDDARLIRTARQVNDAKPKEIIGRVKTLIEQAESPTVACFGLTYKADVDDIRESPALAITEALAAFQGARLLVCEPNLAHLPERLAACRNVSLVPPEQAARDADIVVFLVGHCEFKQLDPALFAGKRIVDAIGLISRPKIMPAT